MTSLRGAHLDPNQHNSCVTNNHYPQNSQFNRLTTAVSIHKQIQQQEFLKPVRGKRHRSTCSHAGGTRQRAELITACHRVEGNLHRLCPWVLFNIPVNSLDVNFETICIVTMRSHRRNHLLPSCFSEDRQSSAATAGRGNTLVAQTAKRLQIYNTLMSCSPSVCHSQPRDPLNY